MSISIDTTIKPAPSQTSLELSRGLSMVIEDQRRRWADAQQRRQIEKADSEAETVIRRRPQTDPREADTVTLRRPKKGSTASRSTVSATS